MSKPYPEHPAATHSKVQRHTDSVETLLLIPPRPKVLVVDDESAVRALLYIGLRRAGFLVTQAQNGTEAVEIYRRHHRDIAIVLLGVSLPGLDGPQTLVSLQGINPNVRFCFLNASWSGYSREELLRLGAAFVFEKPLRLASMATLLRQLVENQRKQAVAAPRPSRAAATAPLPGRPRPAFGLAPPEPPDHERRAAVRFPCHLEGSCQPIGRSEATEGWPARVGDVSTTGIRLLLARRFEPGTLLVCELQTDRPSRLLLAHVVHANRADDGNWVMGCILTHQLAEDDVRRLANTTGDVLEVEEMIGAIPELAAV